MAAVTLSGADFWVGDWLIRPNLSSIERGPEVVHVTPRSMAVLIYLAEAGGRVVSRNEILDAVWPRMAVTQDALSQCIVELRKAFRDDSKHAAVIQTIPKVGVRLMAPVVLPGVRTVPKLSAANEDRMPPADAGGAREGRGHIVGRAWRAIFSSAGAIGVAVAVTSASVALWFALQSQQSWRDPLAGAEFSRVTDFIGEEEQAAISRDGRFVAFVSNRDGPWDVFLGQIGTGDFVNLTKGAILELRNPAVRMLGFSPTGSDAVIWTKTTDINGGVVDYQWTVPVVGGSLRRDSVGIGELDWSPDGKRVVYHPSAPGDPLFIAAADDKYGGKQIYVAPQGIHCHFPLWSRDGKSIYFVRGFVPDEMDIWRIRASGGPPEQLTWHNSRVSYPILLDKRTLLYLATAEDGSGPWLHALDLEHRTSHRLKTAGNPYTSIAATPDGRHIVATEEHLTARLWRVHLGGGIAGAADAAEIPIRTQRGVSPRMGPDFLVYRAAKAGTDAIWMLRGDTNAEELWSGVEGRAVAGPALTADGKRVAFTVQRHGLTRLYVMNSDGSSAHKLADELEVRGAPAWSPDGEWIAIAALRDGEPRLFKIPATGNGSTVPLGDHYGIDPVWSPSGQFLIYTGPDVGTVFEIRAVSADGAPHVVPRLFLNRGSRRLDFLGADENTIVFLKGALSHKEFWAVDLRNGRERPLTEFGPGPVIDDFDVPANGRTIVFDRVHEESHVMRVEIAE
jgi:DNA-binding winged helix-turn-helix (wHTH) protein/Tol biopolymer transport system component